MTAPTDDLITQLNAKEKALVEYYNTAPNVTRETLLTRLVALLEEAVEVELATIPLYLGTYYSINRKVLGYDQSPPAPPASPAVLMDPFGAWTDESPLPKWGQPQPSAPIPFIPKTVSAERAKDIQIFANRSGAALMSVVVEEMLHLSLSSNIYYAVTGEPPAIYGKSATSYPAELPGHTPVVNFPLSNYTYDQLWKFLQIEYPDPVDADPGTLNSWATISQLYSAIRCIIACNKLNDSDFQKGAAQKQIQADYYAPNNIDTLYANEKFEKYAVAPRPGVPSPGSAANKTQYEDAPDSHVGATELVTVNSKSDAFTAIDTISNQGEGANHSQWDDGSDVEESHYFKFLTLQSNLENFLNRGVDELPGNQYTVANRWGDDPIWHPCGNWVIGYRTNQHVVAVDISSADEGQTLTGTMTYQNEGPIEFKGTRTNDNFYVVENKWGSDPTWHPGGTWVIGCRTGQRVVQLNISSDDNGNTLKGNMTFQNEGPISFKGTLRDFGELTNPPPVPPQPFTDTELSYFVYKNKINPTTAEYTEQNTVLGEISNALNALYQYMLIMVETIQKAEGHEQKMFFNTGMHASMIWIMDKYIQAMQQIPVTIDNVEYSLAPTFEFIDLGSRQSQYKDALKKLKDSAQTALDGINGDPSGFYSDVSYYLQVIIDPVTAGSGTPPLPDVYEYWKNH